MNMMLTTCVLIAAAADSGDGIAMNGTLTIGASVVTAVLTYLATKKHDEKLARSVDEAVPQPLSIEQTAYQAAMKENAKEHSNLFARLNAVEKQLAELSGSTNAKLESLKEQLVETKAMVSQLFDRICKGGRK